MASTVPEGIDQRTLARSFVVLTCQQPPGVSAEAVARAVFGCYGPLIEAIAARPKARVALHIHGHLLDALAKRHEALLLRIKALVQSGQLEVLGGLFYGGPVALLPESDVRGQIAMAGEFWESFIGVTPQGIFLPEQAWAAELPRLLEDTGLIYGFLARRQARAPEGAASRTLVGRLERGGLPLYTLALETAVSAAYDPLQPQPTVHALTQTSKTLPQMSQVTEGGGLIVPAELFGLWGGLDEGQGAHAWGQLLDALVDEPKLKLDLPAQLFHDARRAEGLSLTNGYAPIVPKSFSLDDLSDWSSFPARFAEVDTLYRRMLRVSFRLKQAIDVMEDEGREAEWSDTLATAQRHVFAAQTPDAFGRGQSAGFADVAIRDATLREVLAAERLLERVMPRGEGELEVEEVDLDGDLSPDIFVSSKQQNTWLTPGRGGSVRALEDIGAGRNLLDASPRRKEAYLSALKEAPEVLSGDARAPRSVRPLPRKEGPPEQISDERIRRGQRDWLVFDDISRALLLRGVVPHLAVPEEPFAANKVACGDKNDYAIEVQAPLRAGNRRLTLVKQVAIPRGEVGIDLHYAFGQSVESEPQSDDHLQSPLLWAIELPLRLGAMPLEFVGEHALAPLKDDASLLHGDAVRKLVLTDGTKKLEVELSRPVEVVAEAIGVTLRDPDGFRHQPGGMVLMFLHKLTNAGDLSLRLRVH